jgi:AP2 domain-containing protein/HNH endonuclease
MEKILINTGPSERGWHVIRLSQGRVAIVDTEDFGWLSQWKWTWGECGAHRKARKGEVGNRGRYDSDTILMHRVIMHVEDRLILVDHWDHDRLNNRRYNLRVATSQQNSANMRIRPSNRSGVKGVVWDKDRGKWAAYIKVNYRSIGLGRFDRIEDAAAAYECAAKKYFGAFAFTGKEVIGDVQ